MFSFILKRYGVALGVAGGAVGTAVGAGGSLVYLLYKYKKDKTIKRISKQRMHTNRYILNYIIDILFLFYYQLYLFMQEAI